MLVFFCASSESACNASHNETPATKNVFHPYPVKHAMIHMEYKGAARGYEDLAFDNYGANEAHLTHFEIFSDEGFRPTFNLAIKRGENVTIIDSVRMTGSHFRDEKVDSIERLAPGDMPTPEQNFKQFFGGVDYRNVGDTVLNGYKLQVWQQGQESTKLFVWNWIVVGRHTISQQGPLDVTPVSIDTVTPVDPKRFEVPNAIPIQDRPKPAGLQ